MTRLTWSETTERFFETGLDRGVFYPNTGLAVPWNGLISVDEDGAESATEYYMDGRPFLYLPRAKEFSATLTAFTYPDAFSEVMGVAEITDGMYLDSQLGDSFGLSYRTLVGSDAQSTNAGYKIHVVYNATVAPQSSSYETLSDSLSPTNFSWQIKAVPVPIEGWRPTAHVVIDTRHMDDIRLAVVENLLYGSGSTVATLPDPQTLLDALHFGDAIIITDNDDGTWTAEGSYNNVYLVSPGVFQIDNVNAIGYGDGTYDISSTP